jgi:hypothetical protein
LLLVVYKIDRRKDMLCLGVLLNPYPNQSSQPTIYDPEALVSYPRKTGKPQCLTAQLSCHHGNPHGLLKKNYGAKFWPDNMNRRSIITLQ